MVTNSAELFTFIGLAEKPTTDAVSAALDVIEEKARKVPYDSKTKWLRFTGSDMAFLKAVRSKMASQLRRAYGNSRQLNAVVTIEDGVPTLYVHSERY